MRVSCRAGWGGGEPQHFSLSVLEVEGGLQTEVASDRSNSPELTVRGLSPARPYLLAVTAANTRGRSDPVFVPAEVEAAVARRPAGRTAVLYTILAVLGGVMLLSLLLSLSTACRARLHTPPVIEKVESLTATTEPAAAPLLSPEQKPQRKVSFCELCQVSGREGPGVRRAVVRSYSIDKLRPKCYTCNPSGETPYPLAQDSQAAAPLL